MKVFTLLYCRSDEAVEGNLLFFDSIRVGFPENQITVASNSNTVKFNQAARQRCDQVSAQLLLIDREITHSQFIKHLVMRENEPFYLIDPDTIWHERMAAFTVPLAGRYIPDFYDEFTGCNTYARLHTSCLFLDPVRIRSRYRALLNKFDFDPIAPSMYFHNGKWFRHDCCSKLFYFIEDAHVFSAKENEKFSHLFCGTHLHLPAKAYPALPEAHEKFLNGEMSSQELLEFQDSFFGERPWR